MMDIQKISALLNIAACAIEVERLSTNQKMFQGNLNDAYNAYKLQNGIERVERDTIEWIMMMESTKKEYSALVRAKRRVYNARRRLSSAVRGLKEGGAA